MCNLVLPSAETSSQQWVCSLSNDLQSHFPNPSCSPVKRSVDTEAKASEITLMCHWMRISFFMCCCLWLNFHKFKMPSKWMLSVFVFFLIPGSGVEKKNTAFIAICFLIRLPLAKDVSSFPKAYFLLPLNALLRKGKFVCVPHFRNKCLKQWKHKKKYIAVAQWSKIFNYKLKLIC